MKVTSRGLNLVYQVDAFSGDGTTATFTLSQSPFSITEPMVSVDGLFQNPAGYSISGLVTTFTAAPAASTDILIRYLRNN